MFDMDSLVALACCANLQHLAVCMAPGEHDPRAADWAVLAALTRLTELRLMNVSMSKPSTEACEALSKLSRLQVAAAGRWCQGFLPTLVACGQLTEIVGFWDWSSSKSGVLPTLPQVLTLSSPRQGGYAARAPFECFPNLRYFREDVLVDGLPYAEEFVITADDLCSLCQHCTGLRELVLTANHASFHDDVQEASCIAAIQSLTSLQQHTRLSFTPSTDFEFLAMVQA
jgi:hypothetical protein